MQTHFEKFPSFSDTRNSPEALTRKMWSASVAFLIICVPHTRVCHVNVVVWTDLSTPGKFAKSHLVSHLGTKVMFLGAHLHCSSRMKGFEGLEALALSRPDPSLQSFQILGAEKS